MLVEGVDSTPSTSMEPIGTCSQRLRASSDGTGRTVWLKVIAYRIVEEVRHCVGPVPGWANAACCWPTGREPT